MESELSSPAGSPHGPQLDHFEIDDLSSSLEVRSAGTALTSGLRRPLEVGLHREVVT